MTVEYNEKGKIFTNIVSKDAVPVTIQTVTHCLRGFIYVQQGRRIKDEMDGAEPFIAITDVTVYDARGGEVYRAGFMVLNREHIIWLIPDEEITFGPGVGDEL